MRKVPFVENEYYHLYNRGVDRRNVFGDLADLSRFVQSIKEFNSINPIGSIFENFFNKDSEDSEKLVEIICYCLNPNHFHLLVRQLSGNGISEFMKRLSGGYTLYFNNKYKRSGALFQGKFKSSHINSDSYLRHVSAYINLNNRFKGKPSYLSRSSWEEYLGRDSDYLCNIDIVIGQFKNISDYQNFALDTLKDIVKRKEMEKELEF